MPDRVQRRIDQIFGEVLPTVTRDERAQDEVRPGPEVDGAEADLLANRPPHHDPSS